jgi:hypothetical protein
MSTTEDIVAFDRLADLSTIECDADRMVEIRLRCHAGLARHRRTAASRAPVNRPLRRQLHVAGVTAMTVVYVLAILREAVAMYRY